MTAPVHSTVDFSTPGKQHGHLSVPLAREVATNLQLPLTVLVGGEGPSALVMAGDCGDEYPGQVAILRLARELEPHLVSGRLILIPLLTLSGDLHRLIAGEGKPRVASGAETSTGVSGDLLQQFLATVLYPLVDVVVDVQAGGRDLQFYPCAHMHPVADAVRRQAMIEGALAWNTDFALVSDVAHRSPLMQEADRQGKIVISGEMGAADPVTAATHQLTQAGLRNVLLHFGVIAGLPTTRSQHGLPRTRWLEALGADDYRFAPASGVYECLLPLGAEVAAGEAIGMIHSPEHPQREPQVVVASMSGVLMATRNTSRVAQGDCVACVAHEVDPLRLG